MKSKLMMMTSGMALIAGCAVAFAHEGQSEIFYADPTVFVENGKYYLSGTRDSRPAGFTVVESVDLENWKYVNPDDSLILGVDPSLNYGTHGFWAPQFFKTPEGKYQLLYTANEQVAVADCDDIAGRYAQPEVAPVDGSAHNIDPFLFRDDDGTYYLYHVRFDHGNFIWVAEYDPATRSIKMETLQQCFANTQPWEKTDAFPCDPIMEGPGVVKIDGTYYLFYSCNHFLSPDYAVGYATAPTPLGPWIKNPANPIINRDIVGEKGSGHGDVFPIIGESDKLGYVYHVHNSDSVATPRRTRIITLNLTPAADTKGIYTITADPTTIIKPKL
ncbi:MAG: family 43 glycosylhydrolase [Barnesiella sp.]|nr:family 43 glycosylhydrolase [Barnesiella sp.]